MHQSFVATAPPHRVDNSRVNPGKVQSNDYSIIPAVQWKCQGCDSLKEWNDCSCIRRKGTKSKATDFQHDLTVRGFQQGSGAMVTNSSAQCTTRSKTSGRIYHTVCYRVYIQYSSRGVSISHPSQWADLFAPCNPTQGSTQTLPVIL